jgi:hypothetical protein
MPVRRSFLLRTSSNNCEFICNRRAHPLHSGHSWWKATWKVMLSGRFGAFHARLEVAAGDVLRQGFEGKKCSG